MSTTEQQTIEWKPSKRQTEFLRIPDEIFEALYGGAAGGGKTDALLNLPLAREFYQEPRFKGILFRRTFPELEAEVIQRSQAQGLFNGCGAQYHVEKKRWQFPSGATFKFSHLEYDSDVRKHDSAEYNYIAWDELTSFTEYMYTYMFSRCRSSVSRLPSIIRSGTNPGGIGHRWVRERFVEPAPYGTIIKDTRTELKRIFIQSFAKDNPYLMQNDPQYLNRLAGMAEKDRRAKLDGDWYTFGGQVFTDFREVVFENEPLNALHVIQDFSIPEWWPRLLCIDWGFNAMTYALWGAISPDGKLYLYREYAIKQSKISEWAREVGELSQGEQISDIVICQSANQNRGDDLTIAQQFEKYSKLRPRLSQNEAGSRVASKLILQDLIRWKPRPSNFNRSDFPFSQDTANAILRNKGLSAYKDYITSFEAPVIDSKIPKLQIFDSLKVLIKTIPLCIYDDNRPEDVAEFSGDDPYDCLRYMGRAFDRYSKVHLLEEKQNSLIKEASIIEQLKASGNYNSYYRQMEALERSSKKKVTVGYRRSVYHRN